MAQQQSTSAPPQEVKRLIPKQPECNIGTSGHVDSGKCLVLDEYVIVGGRLTTGRKLLGSLESKATLISRLDAGVVHQLEENEVVSIGQDLRPTKAKSLLYTQEYASPPFKATTSSRRTITITP